MLKKKLLVLGLVSAFSFTMPALAKTTSLEEIQDLPSAYQPMEIGDPSQVIKKDNWAYKTLENISNKYGLLVGNPKEKFSIDKPLTRKEAAVILVSLVGKIEQSKVQLNAVEKDRIEILKQELGGEIAALAGRVDAVESSVDALEGRVTKVEGEADKSLKVGFGEQFQLGGLLQAQYNGTITKGQDNYPGAYNFSLPIAEFRFKGKLHKHLDYLASMNAHRTFDGNSGLLGDAFVSTDIIPNHTVYLGQTRLPIGHEGAMSPVPLETIVKSQIARAGTGFNDTRDIGIKVAGNYPLFDYYVGVYNGSGQNGTENKNRNMDLGGWLVLKPFYKNPKLGVLELGGGAYNGKSGSKWTPTSISNNTIGYYVGYKYGKFAIRSEFAEKKGYANISGNKARGWYIMPTYFVTPKLQLLAKMDIFDPSVSANNNNIEEYTLGGNYYLSGNSLKLQTNLVGINNHAGKDSYKVVVQTQYSF